MSAQREESSTDKPVDAMSETPRTPHGPVELRLPAEATQLSLVRVVVHGMAVRANFDLDAVADAQMAVDEACAQLIELGDPGAVLCCRFVPLSGRLRVCVSATTRHADPPSTHTFGWHVLSSLTEHLTTEQAPSPEPGVWTTCVNFTLPAGADAG